LRDPDCAPSVTQGNVINDGTNELILPNFMQTSATIRKISDAPAPAAHLSFTSTACRTG